MADNTADSDARSGQNIRQTKAWSARVLLQAGFPDKPTARGSLRLLWTLAPMHERQAGNQLV